MEVANAVVNKQIYNDIMTTLNSSDKCSRRIQLKSLVDNQVKIDTNKNKFDTQHLGTSHKSKRY